MHDYFGIIPARAGSKGIPGKNLSLIAGRPMIDYTFRAALDAVSLDACILSSDDPAVIALALDVGVEAPFVRPMEHATDIATMVEVVDHAVAWYEKRYSGLPKSLVLLQPTSPFRTGDDIDQAICLYATSEKDSLVSVCETSQPPSDCLVIDNKGSVRPVEVEKKVGNATGRQSFCPTYFVDGAIYIINTRTFLRERAFLVDEVALFEMPQSHSIDVDSPFDLEVARAVAEYSHNHGGGIMHL